jgi:hypothetical protein
VIDSTLALKLGVRGHQRVALVHAPADFELDAPATTTVRCRRSDADVVLAFFTRARDLALEVGTLARHVFPSGSLWIAWPKRSSGRPSDLSDRVVRDMALALGLVDNKVCSVDDTSSALRFVWRIEYRIGPRSTN